MSDTPSGGQDTNATGRAPSLPPTAGADAATTGRAASPVSPTPGASNASFGQAAAWGSAPASVPTTDATNPGASDTPASTPAEPEKDALRDLVLRLGQAGATFARSDQALGRVIENLVREVDQPGRREDAVYRTRVAYAVQDAEKQSAPIAMAPNLRAELGALGVTYPGLQNDRMRTLVASTASIDDRGLVRDIRSQAMRIAGQPDQATSGTNSLIDVLENRARLSTRIADATVVDLPFAIPGGGGQGAATAGQPQSAQSTSRATSPANAHQQAEIIGKSRPGRVMVDIMTALRMPEPTAPAPWDRQLTPMGDRITAYTAKMREGEQGQVFRGAERSGQAALTAMKDFSVGPGAVLMTRIRDAAKADPNGMTGVLAEMREGGRYAGLRQDFNAAAQQEKGFAAAYERAAGAVAKYGADRVEVDKIAAARTDVAAIDRRFQKLDAEIGNAASMLPGKTEGKSFTDELAERASEVVRRAVDAVTNAFNRLRPTASPSPSP